MKNTQALPKNIGSGKQHLLRGKKDTMAKSNRNHFNPNAHMYQQEACKRDTFEELMGNSAVFAAIAQNSKEAVKELRNLNRQFARFRSDIVPLCNSIIDYLELNGVGDTQTMSQSTDDEHKVGTDGAEETVKCALCVDFDMNEIVRAAINATGEDEITVKRITKVIIAYLKAQMDGKTLMAKSFMAKMDAVLKKRAEGEADGYRLDTICQEVRFDDNVYLLLKRCQGVWLITDVGLISETLVDERKQVSGKAGRASRTTTWTYFPFWVWQRITTGLRTVLRQVLCGWGCKPEHA